jgi:hypothetical protein
MGRDAAPLAGIFPSTTPRKPLKRRVSRKEIEAFGRKWKGIEDRFGSLVKSSE